MEIGVVATRQGAGDRTVELRHWGHEAPGTVKVLLPLRRFELGAAGPATDARGFPGVHVEIKDKDAFRRFTGAHVGDTLAFVIAGKVVSVPYIAEPLSNSTTFGGRFTDQDVSEILTCLGGDKP